MTDKPMFDKQSLWQFSADFYQHASVKQACLRLQDQYKLNVNLVLFLLWYSTSRQQIVSSKHIEQMLDALALQDDWVQRYREFRRSFWASMERESDFPPHDVKQALLDTELTLEAEVQAAIIEYANKHLLTTNLLSSKKLNPIELEFVAHENLDTYFRFMHPNLDQPLLHIQQTLLHSLLQFPLQTKAA